MALPRVLVLVLAGGAGGRLELLTEQRAKPAVPFAGVYRLIDFPLSNCLHSGIADVWVSIQFHPTSLSAHLANGRPWDLDRTDGGLLVLPPYQGTDRAGWVSGTANSLWRYAPLVRDLDPDALVVVSSDAVYKLDYREVVDGPFDAIASIGMAEHVGLAQLPRYAARLHLLLRPGGRLLNHAIARGPAAGPDRPDPGSFLTRYVFPDGEVQPLATHVRVL